MEILKWQTTGFDAECAEKLEKELGISNLVARVLCSRGFCDAEKARAFLRTDYGALLSPFFLKDMDLAVERISMAVEDGEKIAVYGDYDVDGITATYILTDYLRSLGTECIYYIPERAEEGYGVNLNAIETLKASGVSLIITVDTGITAVEEVEKAKAMGIDFVITDHHECQGVLPQACAVVNPHRPDCEYPEKNLAGVGVAFKLICALEEDVAERYLQFVCIGTIADVMPLTGENRVIAYNGLKQIDSTQNTGLKALITTAGMSGKKATSDVVGFHLAPRINAAGRMGSAACVVELFSAIDENKANELAEYLCKLNIQRRETENEIFKMAVEQVNAKKDLKDDYGLVVSGEKWHQGVLGIVASRVMNKYRRPTVLISFDGEDGKGSGRSVNGVNLFSALKASSEFLETFGGHELAAGLGIKKDRLEEFTASFNDAVKEEMKKYQPSVNVDLKLKVSDLTLDNVKSLEALQPFGTGNPTPVFVIENAKAERIEEMGAGKHLRFVISDGERVNAVMFNNNSNDISVNSGENADLLFNAEINVFRGENVQLIVRDIRPSGLEYEEFIQDIYLYKKLKNGIVTPEETERIRITYQQLAAFWRYIKSRGGKVENARLSDMCKHIETALQIKLKPVNIAEALDIFAELGFLTYSMQNRVNIKLNENIQKMDLSQSQTAQRLGCTAP